MCACFVVRAVHRIGQPRKLRVFGSRYVEQLYLLQGVTVVVSSTLYHQFLDLQGLLGFLRVDADRAVLLLRQQSLDRLGTVPRENFKETEAALDYK